MGQNRSYKTYTKEFKEEAVPLLFPLRVNDELKLSLRHLYQIVQPGLIGTITESPCRSTYRKKIFLSRKAIATKITIPRILSMCLDDILYEPK